jgi:hypothetical protein
MTQLYRNLEERLIANSYVSDELFFEGTACWLWFGHCKEDGYGTLNLWCFKTKKRKKYKAHRVAYEVFTGKKLRCDREIDHLCCIRNCINPAHLRAVKYITNLKARDKRKRINGNQQSDHRQHKQT